MKIDTEGTYTLRYTAEDECGNVTTEDRTVNVAEPVYGVYWDGSANPKMVRTDLATDFEDPQPAVNNGTGSSPFDDIMPWSGMQIVQDANAGTLVSIPKFWYKWTQESGTNAFKLQIANKPIDGYKVSPAHADRDDGVGVRDVVYVGRYHCSETDFKSTTNVLPKVERTRAQFRTAVTALGNGIYMYDLPMYNTIMMLYMVEYANFDSQLVIGKGGRVAPVGSLDLSGMTDAMQYHTGTSAATRDANGAIQYRHIEGLWSGGVGDILDGTYSNVTNNAGGLVRAYYNPTRYNENGDGSAYTAAVLNNEASSGPASRMSFNGAQADSLEMSLFSSRVSGATAQQYFCDAINITEGFGNGGGFVRTSSGSNWWAGLFNVCYYTKASDSSSPIISARVQKLPSA